MSFYLIIFSTILTALIGYLRYRFSYWEYRGVPQLKTNPFFGNFFKHRSISHYDLLQEVYDEFKGKAKLAGTYIFGRPVAVILDLDLVKSVLIKDFNNFVNRTDYENTKDLLSNNLFVACGETWHSLRSNMTPTFTSGKMKFMFPTITDVANEFIETLDIHMRSTGDGNVEIYDLLGRFTTDVIGTCVFGIKCNSLKDPNSEFRKLGKRIFSPLSASVRVEMFRRTYPNLLKYFGAKKFPQDIEKFIFGVVEDTVTTREKLKIHRNDFIDLLIELKNKKDENAKPLLNFNLMVAQVFVFFAAGFETSSSNLSFGLYEMAKNPHIQEKVRDEILHVLEKYNGEITYDAMMDMKYLDQIVTETLRKYPALAALQRITGHDYKVPGTDIVIEKGTEIMVPAMAIHYDPDIYENPEEFRPERFDPEEVKNRHFESFLGFGDGPRNCIGLRFGRMLVRIGLIMLLRNYRFSICEKTPKKLEVTKRNLVLIPSEKIWLKVESL